MDGPDSKIIDLPGEGYSFGASNQAIPGNNIIGVGDTINALPARPPAVAAKPAPTVVPTTINVGGRVQAAMIQHRVEPVYPTLAKQTRVQGTVVLAAVIGTDGHIQALHVVSGHPLLVGEAMKAVQQWTYNPTFLNDQKVSVSTTIEVRFTLTN